MEKFFLVGGITSSNVELNPHVVEFFICAAAVCLLSLGLSLLVVSFKQ